MVDQQMAGLGGHEHKGLDGKDAAALHAVACEANEVLEGTCDSKVDGWIWHPQRAMLSVPTTVDGVLPTALFSWFLISPRWCCQEEVGEVASEVCVV